MAIDQDVVRRVAHLARLHVDDPEARELSQRLSSILDMVDSLQQADVADVAPLAHPLEVTQPLREDAVTDTNIRDEVQTLAPAAEGGLYLVPRVIE